MPKCVCVSAEGPLCAPVEVTAALYSLTERAPWGAGTHKRAHTHTHTGRETEGQRVRGGEIPLLTSWHLQLTARIQMVKRRRWIQRLFSLSIRFNVWWPEYFPLLIVFTTEDHETGKTWPSQNPKWCARGAAGVTGASVYEKMIGRQMMLDQSSLRAPIWAPCVCPQVQAKEKPCLHLCVKYTDTQIPAHMKTPEKQQQRFSFLIVSCKFFL